MLIACAERQISAHEIDCRTARSALLGHVSANGPAILTFLKGLGLNAPLRRRGAVDLDIANAMLMAIYGLRFQSADRVPGINESRPQQYRLFPKGMR